MYILCPQHGVAPMTLPMKWLVDWSLNFLRCWATVRPIDHGGLANPIPPNVLAMCRCKCKDFNPFCVEPSMFPITNTVLVGQSIGNTRIWIHCRCNYLSPFRGRLERFPHAMVPQLVSTYTIGFPAHVPVSFGGSWCWLKMMSTYTCSFMEFIPCNSKIIDIFRGQYEVIQNTRFYNFAMEWVYKPLPKPRQSILRLIEYLKGSSTSWGCGRVLHKWIHQQPWRVFVERGFDWYCLSIIKD